MRLYYLSLRSEGKRVLRGGLRVPKRRGKPTGISLLTNEGYCEMLLERVRERRHGRLYLVIVDIPCAWCRSNGKGKVLCMRDIPVDKIRGLGWIGDW